jgi:hypothetical protein
LLFLVEAKQTTQQDTGHADGNALSDIGFAEKKSGSQRG